ncbi:hypothetical protein LP414_27445 [Polaromonas sp. P1(28)-13]|nr:hypothetical protein LP414_27445 [Polaromonas sp. P1(28)-13]
MTKAIALGNTVHDITTGIQGVATSKVEFLTGNVQYAVQPKGKEDGAYVDALSYDTHQLDFVDVGIAARVTPAPAETGITLGEKVQDIVTKFAGIATRKTTFMNGCIYYSVQGEVDGENQSKEDFVEFNRLKVVGKGIVAVVAKRLAEAVAKAPAAATRPPGGPVSRLMARG